MIVSNNARTDNVSFPISEFCDGTVSLEKKISVKDNKAIRNLQKFKVEEKCKLKAKDNNIKTLNKNIKKEKRS